MVWCLHIMCWWLSATIVHFLPAQIPIFNWASTYHIILYVYIYICIFIRVYVYICVCVSPDNGWIYSIYIQFLLVNPPITALASRYQVSNLSPSAPPGFRRASLAACRWFTMAISSRIPWHLKESSRSKLHPLVMTNSSPWEIMAHRNRWFTYY